MWTDRLFAAAVAIPVLSMLSLGGCSVELEPASDTLISCESDSQCPGGWRCASGIDRCVLTTAETDPPGLLPVIAPPPAGPGHQIELVIEPTEPLDRPPEVLLDLPVAEPWTRISDEAEEAEGHYRYLYVVGSTGESGTWPVLATLTDLAGNKAAGLLVTSVTLDFDPPTATAATFEEDQPGFVTSLTCEASVTLTATDAVEFRISGTAVAAPSGWLAMPASPHPVALTLSCNPGSPLPDDCTTVYADDGARSVQVVFRDAVGNEADPVVATTVLERSCPSSPVLRTPASTVINSPTAALTLETPSIDEDFVDYQLCQCVRPCAEEATCTAPCPVGNDCSPADTSWAPLGQANPAQIDFLLAPNRVNRLCVRGEDGVRAGDADCIEITHDDIPPVTQLKCWSDTGDGVVQEGELLDCGTGRYDGRQRFVLRAVDRNLPAAAADVEVYLGTRGATPQATEAFRYRATGPEQIIAVNDRSRDRWQAFSVDAAGNAEPIRSFHISFCSRFERIADLLESRRSAIAIALGSEGVALLAGGQDDPRSSAFFLPVSNATVPGPRSSLGAGAVNSQVARLTDTRYLFTNGYSAELLTFSANDVFDAQFSLPTFPNQVTSRSDYTMTAFAPNKALVAGGCSGLACNACPGVNCETNVAQAEIYDHVVGGFVADATMITPRKHHSAVGLADGRVLICGGLGNGSSLLSSCEIYDPNASGGPAFVSTGSMSTARWLHAAVELPNGDVLIIGGSITIGSTYTTSVERWRLATGTFSAAPSLPAAITDVRAWHVGDGQVVALARGDDAYSFDGTAWTTLAFPSTGQGTAGVILGDGRLMVSGGLDAPRLNRVFDSRELSRRTMPTMPFPVADAIGSLVALPDGGALMASTMAGSPYLQRFRPADGIWEAIDVGAVITGDNLIRTVDAVLMPDNSVATVGPPLAGSTLATIYRFDLAAQTLEVLDTVTGGQDGDLFATLTSLEDGRALLAGGIFNDAPMDATYLIQPNGSVVAGPTLAAARVIHRAVRLASGNVLLSEGWDFAGGLNAAEVLSPVTMASVATPGTACAAAGWATLIALPDGRAFTLGGVTQTGTLPLAACFYEPGSGGTSDFRQVGEINGQYNSAAVLLAGGDPVVVGGAYDLNERGFPSDLMRVDAGAERIDYLSNANIQRTKIAATTLADGRILVAGGGAPGDGTEVDLYDWVGNREPQRLAPSSRTVAVAFDPPLSHFSPPPSCFGGRTALGADRAYRLELREGHRLRATVSPTSGATRDVGLYVVQDPTQFHGGFCYAAAEREGPGGTEVIDDFLVPHDGVFTLVIDSSDLLELTAVDLTVDVDETFGTVSEQFAYGPVSIPDGAAGAASLDVVVGDGGTIADVTVRMVVDHPAPEQLLVELLPPGGSAIVLHDHTAASTGGIYRSFGGQRVGALAALAGGAGDGSWSLRVVDTVAGTAGSLRNWSLVVGWE